MPEISWSIEIELDEKGVTADGVDELMEALAEGHPAIGEAPNGNLSVRIFITGSTAHEAITRGILAVTKATKMEGFSNRVVGVDLVTEDELDRRLAENN